MSSGKVMIVPLRVVLIKKIKYRFILCKMSWYFPKPYDCFKGNIKVELDLPNYVTKARLKGAIGADTSNLATKPDLVS